MVKPIPEGYPRVSPYLIVDGATAAIDFYCSVLGATERVRMPGPDGTIGHAELAIGESVIMLADQSPEMGIRGPASFGGSPVSIMVYVDDVDTVFKHALDAGSKTVQPVEDKFYGDRSGTFEDPFGHSWNISSHIEDVALEEMEKRMTAMMGS